MDFGKTLLIAVISLVLTTEAYPDRCYSCTNDPDEFLPFDSTCGDRNYNGSTYVDTDDLNRKCSTVIKENGLMFRDNTATDLDVDENNCMVDTDLGYPRVFCTCESGDLCNTGICEQCEFPFSTLPSPTTTTTSSPQVLSCYSCYNCPQVDDSTPVIDSPNADSCVTTLMMNTDTIIRAASTDSLIDDGCLQTSESISCYCKTPLCNDQGLGQLLKHQQSN